MSVLPATNTQQRGEGEGDRKAEIVDKITLEEIKMITEQIENNIKLTMTESTKKSILEDVGKIIQ